MIDQEAVRIARERVQLEIHTHMKKIGMDIQHVKNEMNARGMFQSSMTIKRITDVSINAIKDRASLVWQIYFRFLTTTGIKYSPELSTELKELVAYHFPENLGEFKGYVKNVSKLIQSNNTLESQENELSLARRAALAEVGTEIDLFVHSLKKTSENENTKEGPLVFNIYSPIGSIQTGNNATANIVQRLDSDIHEKLVQALDQIAREIISIDDKLPSPKNEIIEIIQEGQQELSKPNPNITRLKSILPTVGSTIQTIASMKPAYETLKQALSFLGIDLP